MKTLSFIAVLLVAGTLAAIISKSIREYEYQRSVAGLAASEKLSADIKAKSSTDDHVNMLAADNCSSRVILIKSQNQALKIARSSDIPAALRSDLSLCVARGLLRPWDRDDLRLLGLLEFLKSDET